MLILEAILLLYLIPVSILEKLSGQSQDEPPVHVLNSLHLTLSERLLLDIKSPRGHMIHGYLGWFPLRTNSSYKMCSDLLPPEFICLEYSGERRLIIQMDNDEQCFSEESETCDAISCYRIHWENHLIGAMDCFALGDDHWYGGGERLQQHWPLRNDAWSWHAFVTGDPIHHSTGSVVENLWLSSGGFSIYIDQNVPLFVSFNESDSGKLCFTTGKSKHPYKWVHDDSSTPQLSYTVCSGHSVKDIYLFSAKKWFDKPSNISDETMFQNPIWSTWARHKEHINLSTILEFAREVNERRFPKSQMEIDDNWETCYGDMEFEEEKFPNPDEMVKILKYLGFRTVLWIHPFCNLECETYQIGEQNGFWVKDAEGKTAEVKWWNGVGALLDVTNACAVEWFVSRIKKLAFLHGIDSFKFDAGEVSWLPESFILHNKTAHKQPNIYTNLYAKMAAELGRMVEVRVGYRTQSLPIFLRMFDKFSKWGYDNGLKTVIPTALHFSLMGYPFFIPDMIGGNNYDFCTGSLPERELYIRWLQVNVFLPVMQFSITPWDYDDEVTAIANKMIKLHFKYSFLMLSLASEAVTDNKPIIRPLWWIAPDDSIAQQTDSEFLLGDGLLVAPVLERGKLERDIYLPEGLWMDVLRGDTLEGPIWLYNYRALLDELPYFIRQPNVKRY